MAKILLIGQNSFIGRNFKQFSKFKDVDEISLFENEPENINFLKYDVVIHLVAIVHQSKRIGEIEYMKVNRDLCLRVANKAKLDGVRHFIFLSSVKVYGKYQPGADQWNESSQCFPVDSYGKSKYEAELALKLLEDPGFVISIIRTPLVYGEEVKAHMQSIIKLVSLFPVLPFGAIQNKRSFTFVGNLVAFIDRIIKKRASGIFIAMDERPLSTTELISIMGMFLNKRIFLFKLPSFLLRIGNIFFPDFLSKLYGSYEFDNHNTLEILDFSPPYESEYGLKKMVLAFQQKKNKKT